MRSNSIKFRPMPFGILVALFLGSAFATGAELTPTQLEALVAKRRLNVPEFRWLAEWGKKKGVHVWAAGGTATGIATYVKSDHLVPGKKRGYKYHQIYRATQDADIVIDADEATALELEAELKSRFNHLQGEKSAWEVRLLRGSRGTGPGLKEPLIGNRNFREQHSDSYSTGMVELTDPPPGKPVVRDLFDWENPKSQFLTDIAAGKIHYHFSPTHATTARALAGVNPPILSVLRYITKAGQYSAETSEADLTTLRRIVDRFDPSDPSYRDRYVRKQIESNARKIYLHSRNLESSHALLSSLGLLEKLVEFGKETEGSDGISSLFRRLPLTTKTLGTGTGRTARELFGDGDLVVTHTTDEYFAYESISRSTAGDPNVFQSIAGQKGQNALHGDGFYTKLGREGSALGSLSVRFLLDPGAREGTDFYYVAEKRFLVIRNKRALRVIDESLHMKPFEYFEFVSGAEIKKLDTGIRRRLSLEMQSEMVTLSAAERSALEGLIEAKLVHDRDPRWLLEVLFDFKLFPEKKEAWMKSVFARGGLDATTLLNYLQENTRYATELVTFSLLHGTPEHWMSVYIVILNRWPDALRFPEWMGILASKNTKLTDNVVNGLIRVTDWGRQPELVRACGGSPSAEGLRWFLRDGGVLRNSGYNTCDDLLEVAPDPFASF